MAYGKDLSKSTSDSLLKGIRDRFDYATAEWADIRSEGKTDMRHVAGDPWDPTERQAREKAKRPVIAVDELNQYFNQVINGVRANQRAVKFSPVGNGANDEGAEFYADKMREIEYRSKAQIAYTTAFQDAVQRGYGFCRVNTRFATTAGQRFNQDIWIEDICNPDLVMPDPDAKRPDSSDMLDCYVYESWRADDFRKRFGQKAKIHNFTGDVVKEAPNWIKGDSLTLAEYWQVKTRERKLLLVQPGPIPGQQAEKPVDIWEDEFLQLRQDGDQVIHDRMAEDRSVCQYLTNGIEILEKKDWPGQYIPIVSCYGKVLYVDSGAGAKRVILSMTRLARDPYMLYCYYRTTQAELVGMTPKTPYMAYEGQLDAKQLNEIARSLHEPVAIVTAKAYTEETGQQVLPLPQRQPYRPEIELLEIGAEGARRAIQSAMATNFMPTQAQRRNEKSGKALDKIDEVAQRGSFHFNDHYDDMITQVGVIVEDLMDKVYDSDREVGIRKQNDESKVITINAQSQDEDGRPIEISTKGDYQVTVSTGPAFDSTREAESQFADLLMESPFAPRIADLVMKLKGGGPIMDEIADRLTPPEFRKQKEGQPDPAQIQQMMGQMQAENQNLKQILSQLAMDLKTKKIEIESKEKIALAEIQSRERMAESKDVTAITTTQMKLESSEKLAEMEAAIARVQSILDGHEAEMSRVHEASRAAQDHGLTLEQGDRGLQGALLEGEQGHINALEQLAAQPKPTNGNTV